MSHDADESQDERILRALREGDRDAASQLVIQLAPLISRLVFRLTGWHNDTQDLIQDVFLNIQKSSAQFRGNSRLETWVTSIVMNRCRNWHRSRSRQPELSSLKSAETGPVSHPDDSLDINDTIQLALRQLTVDDRELVVLRYLEEKELDEISQLTGIRRNTIEVRLHRARQEMQAGLTAHQEGFHHE